MTSTVFIDGKEGTTGLRIFDRLQSRKDITVLTLPEELRKDAAARQEAIRSADIAILCLPDAAARESVALAEGSTTRILDTSTAHRVASGWTYGFPEIRLNRREEIAKSSRVAVPGCHASGFIAIAAPLVAAGLISSDEMLSCFSLTGYSGGGKKMITQYEAAERDKALDAPRQYGLTQIHKHLPEMQQISGLTHAPIFAPVVADYYSGMEVTVPLFRSQVNCVHPMQDVTECLKAHYTGSHVVTVLTAEEVAAQNGFIAANAMSGLDSMKIMVLGNDDRLQIVSLFDNLGKGSSGAALQCLNLMLGVDELTGLAIK